MSFSCDGANDYAYCTSSPISGYGSGFSIVAWVKQEVLTNARALVGLTTTANATSTTGSALVDMVGIRTDPEVTVGNGARPTAMVADATNQRYATRPDSAGGLLTTDWNLLVGLFNSSTSRQIVYNADYPGNTHTSAATTPSAALTNIIIGAGVNRSATGGPSNDFNGKLAHIALYGNILTEAQIDALYAGENPLQVNTANLLAYYPPGTDIDSSLLDLVGGYNLTKFGNIAYSADNPTVNAPRPIISSVSDSTYFDGETGIVITGLGFAQTQGTGSVIISPTDNVNDAAAVTQTVTSWATNSVTFTAKQVAMLVNAQCYLFVKSSFGLANASGWPVTFKFRGPITPRTILRAQSATVAGS